MCFPDLRFQIKKIMYKILFQTHNTINTSSCKGMMAYFERDPTYIKEVTALSYFGGKMTYKHYQAFNRVGEKFSFELYMALEEFK